MEVATKKRGKFYKQNRKNYLKHKKERIEITYRWQKANPAKVCAATKNLIRRWRKQIIQLYGGKCACYGENKYEFLAIDHKFGGGNKHRKQRGSSARYLRWILNNRPSYLRILCHNCNSAIGFYGYCPHKKRRQKCA